MTAPGSVSDDPAPRHTCLPRNVPIGTYRRTLQAVRRFRLNLLFGLLLVLFGAMLGRLLQLQVLEASSYREQARARQRATFAFPAGRGRLLDRHGVVMAESKPCVSLAIDPHEDVIKDPATFAMRVSRLVDGVVTYREVLEKVEALRERATRTGKPIARYARLRRKIDDPILLDRLWAFRRWTSRRKMNQKLYGLIVEPIEGRWYPNGTDAAHVLGRIPVEGVAPEGMEGVLDPWLRGLGGKGRAARDGHGQLLVSQSEQGQERGVGSDIRLTIDLVVQHHTEVALRQMQAACNSLEGCAVVLDIKSGEVLAMASLPGFDPNKAIPVLNRVTQGRYEPGSVFKPFTVAFALQAGVVGALDTIPMPKRVTLEGDPHPIRDTHLVGDGSLALLVSQSSNTGSAYLAHRLGPARMEEALRRLFPYDYKGKDGGLRCGTGVGLPHESGYRRKRTARPMTPHEAHRAGFGQGFSLTPIQIASAFAAFARADARIVRPTLLPRRGTKGVLGARVCDPKHLPVIQQGLEDCVRDGTAKKAFADCAWDVAGKTATAEQRGTADGLVEARRGLPKGTPYLANVCSFAAYAPVRDPQVVVVVLGKQLDEDGKYGGDVAAPAVRQILDSIFTYWDLPKDREPIAVEAAYGGQSSHGGPGAWDVAR